jgi:SH3 domain-containing YSC84-like protein 1
MRRLDSKAPLTLLVLGAGLLLLAGTTATLFAQDSKADQNKSDIEKRLDASSKVMDEVMAVPDKAIPDKIIKHAKCIAVIPSMFKIAVGFGGSHGKGVATCRLPDGRWSAPAPLSVTGGSWGLQLGGQAVDLVLLFMDQQGVDHLLSSKFKIGADASAAAGPVGRDAAADTDIKMKAEMLTYSRARGLFAGVDLSGTVVTQDKDETRLLYGGKFVPFPDILAGKVAPQDPDAVAFVHTIRKYTEEVQQKGELRKPEAGISESASR